MIYHISLSTCVRNSCIINIIYLKSIKDIKITKYIKNIMIKKKESSFQWIIWNRPSCTQILMNLLKFLFIIYYLLVDSYYYYSHYTYYISVRWHSTIKSFRPSLLIWSLFPDLATFYRLGHFLLIWSLSPDFLLTWSYNRVLFQRIPCLFHS